MFHSPSVVVIASSRGAKFSSRSVTFALVASIPFSIGAGTQSNRRRTVREDHPAVVGLLVVAPHQIGHRPGERRAVLGRLGALRRARQSGTTWIGALATREDD